MRGLRYENWVNVPDNKTLGSVRGVGQDVGCRRKKQSNVLKPLQHAQELDDNMIKFPIIEFWWLSHELMRLEKELGDSISKAWIAEINAVMTFAEGQYVKGPYKIIELGDAATLPLFRIKAALQKFELTDQCTIDMKQELGAMRKGIEIELGKQCFFYFPFPNDKYFEQEKLFGDEVYEKFENARQDLKDAGNCLAASLPIGCIFYLMRVAEHELRRLAKKLHVILTHSGKSCPIEFGDWNKIITGIKDKISEARTLPVGARRQAKLEAYCNAADHCEYMKDIWRNNVSHARKPYKDSEAERAFERVRDFMIFVARWT
jgi:hypothetical protein